MKMAYVTTYDSNNIHEWSGSGYNIVRSLESAGIDIESIGNLSEGFLWSSISKIKKLYYSNFLAKQYQREREPGMLKAFSAQIEKRISDISADMIFSPGTLPVTYLNTEHPIVTWADATFAGMIDFYPNFSNLCSETIRNGNAMEQKALTNCHLAIYASDWAANTAINNYDVDPNKVKVVPFGANIECNREIDDIHTIIENKDSEVCNLLFLGVEWHRKGGDHALEVARLLNKKGLNTILHIVGCDAPYELPSFVKEHGFISKKNAAGQKRINQLLSQAHFLILPSMAECYGVVFAEASSFGLPSLATNVGGISTAIHNGKNGWIFDINDDPESYCNYIEEILTSKEGYRNLAISSFREYTERLNWQSAGNKIYQLINESI